MVYLELFPESGLASSLHTTIFVGLVVYWLLNESFGFALVGMVVPGYLGPLLLIQPQSAVLIVLEAIMTYGIVWWLSERVGRRGPWYPLFGRDRFFAFLYVSIVVRLIVEGAVLPAVGPWLTYHSALPLDFTYAFSSVGLICVALLANAFWKVSLKNGLGTVLTPLVLTTLITAFVLVPFTNFNLIRLEYLYEEIATDISASPKAYIFLLLGAFVASRYNLKYGWDFNGILIPALLALSVFEPLKLVVTLGEGLAIAALALIVQRVPPFSRINFLGARVLILCATIGYLAKLVTGFALDRFDPGANALDFYGFGYLLSALVATKIVSNHKALATVLPLVRTAIVIMVLASLTGLIVGEVRASLAPSPGLSDAATAVVESRGDLQELLVLERVRIRRPVVGRPPDRFSPEDRGWFLEGLRRILAADVATPEALAPAAPFFRRLGYRVELRYPPEGATRRSPYVVLREPPERPDAERRGWGTFIIDVTSTSELLIAAPRPLSEPATVRTAGVLFERLGARLLVIPGTHYLCGVRVRADTLRNITLPLGAIHRELAGYEILHVRGARSSGYYIQYQWPHHVDFSVLKTLIPMPPQQEGWFDADNALRRLATHSFSTLALAPDDLRDIVQSHYATETARSPAIAVPVSEESLAAFLEARLANLPGPGSEAYVAPSAWDLLFLDEEILRPLAAIVRPTAEARAPMQRFQQLGPFWRHACHALGFQTALLRDPSTGRRVLVLYGTETPGTKSRTWGIYVFALDDAKPWIVLAPNPALERGTLGVATDFFLRQQATTLLIPGAALTANAGGTADVTRPDNARSVYQLVHRRLCALTGYDRAIAVEFRGYAGAADTPDVIVGSGGNEAPERASRAASYWPLLEHFLEDGFSATQAGLVPELPLSFGRSLQARFCEAYRVEHWTVRCSWSMRTVFRRRRRMLAEVPLLEALRLETAPLSRLDALWTSPAYAPKARWVEAGARLPAALLPLDACVRRYQETGDLQALLELKRLAREREATVAWFVDQETLTTYLLYREAESFGLFQSGLVRSSAAIPDMAARAAPGIRRPRRWWFDARAPRFQSPSERHGGAPSGGH